MEIEDNRYIFVIQHPEDTAYIYDLFEELKEHPETGTGKPRYKKYDEFWARKVSDKQKQPHFHVTALL